MANAILSTIKREGPLSTADFKEHGHSIDWWWAPTRAARAVLEALFVTGRVGIARREGSRRFYDLIERLVPARPAATSASRRARRTAIGCCRVPGGRAHGAGQAKRGILATGKAAGSRPPDRGARRRRDAHPGRQVEGLRAARYLLADERAVLEATAAAGRRRRRSRSSRRSTRSSGIGA